MLTETQTHPFTDTVTVMFRDDEADTSGEIVAFLGGGVVIRERDRGSLVPDGTVDTSLVFIPFDRINSIVQPE